jgi:hypothetical protein
MCLDEDEQRVVNKTFNAEEYYRESYALSEKRLANYRGMLNAYELILELDSLNESDRIGQLQNWKIAYNSCGERASALQDALKDKERGLLKQERRKKVWRGVAIAGIPIGFGVGLFLPVLIKL